jgi:O-antigen/teichoic acid export membrane protein
MGINLINGIYAARHFGPEGRGVQAAILLWPPFISYLLTFGVPVALRYQARKHEADQNSLFTASFILATITGLAAMLIGFFVVPYTMHKYGASDIRYAQIFMLFAPLTMITFVTTAIFEVRFDFRFSNITKFVPPFVTFAALVTLVQIGAFTPVNTALAYMLPPAAMSIYMLVRLVGTFSVSLGDMRRSFRRLLGFGVRIYGSDILSQFGQQVDQVLVVGFLSASDLGIYTVGLQASRVLYVFQAALSTVLMPKMVGIPTHKIVETVSRACRVTTACAFFAGCGLIIVMPVLLPSMYGHGFVSAVIVSQILVVEAVLGSATGVLSQAFMATNRPGLSTLLQLVGLLAAVPLMLTLIPRVGLIGAAVALLTSTTLRLIVALVCYPTLLRVPIPALLLKRSDVSYLATILNRARGSEGEISGKSMIN